MHLETINSPDDVKTLAVEDLATLADEVRAFLIEHVSETGGHLASNLGAVELTLALHYVFTSPRHRFVFDVGHQSYTHKIITGRRDDFHTIRQTGGLSGFPKRCESEHDIAETGHASTSISVGLGLDRALRENDDEKVIAIIGDGSLTGGMALEAINHAGHIPNNLIIIVNNNEMSIGENIGGFSRYLNRMIQEPGVQTLAGKIESLARRFGDTAHDMVKRFEGSIKAFLAPGIVFRELGFRYLGPVDGHNTKDLVKTLSFARDQLTGPIVIQVNTVKGKGYAHSEERPSQYHGIGAFDIETGVARKKKEKTFSALLGETVCALREKDPRITAITAAMAAGTGLAEFAKRFPDDFFDVGIAEQHAVAFAAGLAIGGKRPVAAIYSTFLQRAYDQVIHDVALMNLPVIFAIDRAGVVPEDGETHQGIFDLAYLRIIPNIEIFSPVGETEFRRVFDYALSTECPVAIRYPKREVPFVSEGISPDVVEHGKAHLVRKGKDGVVFSFGVTLLDVLTATDALGKKPSLAVYNLLSLSPLDEATIVSAAKKYKKVMIIEEGVAAGGIGSAVMEVLAKHGVVVPVTVVGTPTVFLETGARSDLLRECGLDAASLEKTMHTFFTRRR